MCTPPAGQLDFSAGRAGAGCNVRARVAGGDSKQCEARARARRSLDARGRAATIMRCDGRWWLLLQCGWI